MKDSPPIVTAGALGSAAVSVAEARAHVAANADRYVDKLAEAVAIPSVSSDLSFRGHCHRMADLLHGWIESLGGTSEKVVIGFQELEDGTRYDLPPVILASFGVPDRTKPTVLVYGHYDVVAAALDPAEARKSGWLTDPFTLTEVDDKLHGRGTTDNKGPVLAWLWAVETYNTVGKPLPVNLKLCIEGMEASNSECLADLLQREARRGGFLVDCDYLVITNNGWLTRSKPCLTYGLRGLAAFEVDVQAGGASLHSGAFGGCIAEPMTDMVQLLASVTAGGHGDIAIPNCGRSSADPRTEQEESLYRGIQFDLADFKKEAGGVQTLLGGASPKEVLMNRWRYPCLSVHGIEPSNGPTLRTTIPGGVTGRFSIRIVPGQDADVVVSSVKETLEQRFKELRSPNALAIRSEVSRPWLANPKGTLYQAGAAALLRVHGVRADLTREGASIPVVSLLQECIDTETMLLPLGASDDGAHAENEKMNRNHYLNSITVLCTFMEELNVAHANREDAVKPKGGVLSTIKNVWYGLS